ncbi:MAG: hypothetical protein EXX96DRAFT_566216 [Benjaminiella poitrasii]|nr:MAG: hypothetical protein EXX96DRAFT_566216 [Benjaminiella poitrasii]
MVPKPITYDGELNEDITILEDNHSNLSQQSLSAVTTCDTRNETLMLAQFLSTTGPEEYSDKISNHQRKEEDKKQQQQQFRRASRLLNRLRKKPTFPALQSEPTIIEQSPQLTNSSSRKKRNYIPLPVYEESCEYRQHLASPSFNTAITNYSRRPDIKTKPTTTTVVTDTQQHYHHNPPTTIVHKQQQQQQQLRDSGVYSETHSEKDALLTTAITTTTTTTKLTDEIHQFPQPPFSLLNKHQQYEPHLTPLATQSQQPRRPAPLPAAVASAAIASACSTTTTTSSSSVLSSTSSSLSSKMNGGTSHPLRSVPKAALKRRSVRLRHVQVQTTTEKETSEDEKKSIQQQQAKEACPHCRQVIRLNDTQSRKKRLSSPPALASGPMLLSNDDSENNRMLLDMIMKLKSQLEEEKMCRLKLERVIEQQQRSCERREALAKEKHKWADDCLWLNDRIACLLPE